ncbi:MAG: hypothetical protein ACRC6E_09760 [Fusobacteriaceae bacterium]
MVKIGDSLGVLCGFCETELTVVEIGVIAVELICENCKKEEIVYSPKTGWYSYDNWISLDDEEDEKTGTDLYYVDVKQNKTRNKIRRLFEGEIISVNNVISNKLFAILKKEDFDKLHFWEQREKCFCRVKLKKFINKKGNANV